MAKRNLEQYRDAALSLRKHLDSDKFRMHAPERAFIEWYVLARFGKPDEFVFTDGAKDGGIDFWVEHKGKLFIFQSKYEVKPRVSSLTRSEIAGFERTVNILKDEAGEERFQAWLATCKESLHSGYKKLRKRILTRSEEVRYLLVTTKRQADIEVGECVELEDIQQMLALWDLYQDGFTPPTESITITLNSAWHTDSDAEEFKTYVGLADVEDFLRLMDEDKNERLFAQNVRTDLRSRINKDIRKTYEESPQQFWLGNNGVYIVCKKVIPSGNSYRLVFPSIINGSQTLHSVYSSNMRHSCKILIRILEMDVHGNPKLLSEVIRRTNTQNPMKLINLSAHDPFQLNIALYLDRYKLFYERREKEWQNEKKSVLNDYHPVHIKDIAQWLSTLHADIGFGRARSRVSELFQSKYYKQIFNAFDSGLTSSRYPCLADVVWAGLFIRGAVYYLPKNAKSFGKMSQLLLTKLVYDGLRYDERLHRQIDQRLGEHRFGWKEIPRPIISEIKNVIEEFLVLQRREQKKDANVDFSNFFKKDDLCREAYRKVCVPRIQKLARLLIRHDSEIR
jgi:hypothetical protein